MTIEELENAFKEAELSPLFPARAQNITPEEYRAKQRQKERTLMSPLQMAKRDLLGWLRWGD